LRRPRWFRRRRTDVELTADLAVGSAGRSPLTSRRHQCPSRELVAASPVGDRLLVAPCDASRRQVQRHGSDLRLFRQDHRRCVHRCQRGARRHGCGHRGSRASDLVGARPKASGQPSRRPPWAPVPACWVNARFQPMAPSK
jgi:hypothetical protein